MSRRRSSILALKYLSQVSFQRAPAATSARRLSTAAQRTDLGARDSSVYESPGHDFHPPNHSGGFYRENTHPNPSVNEWMSGGEFHHGHPPINAWHNSGGVYREEINPNGSERSNYGVLDRNSSMNFQQNPSRNEWVSAGEFHQTPGGHHGVNAWHNPSGVYREEINPNGSERSNHGVFDRNTSINFQQNPNRGFQQNPNGDYYSHPAQNNPQGFYGDYQQNANYYYSEKTSDFRQSSGFYPSNTQASGQMPSSESQEPIETSGYKGTLEELDGFFREGKMKDAVEVLALLEKKGVMVDIQRFLQLMQACGEARFLEEGRLIHGHISRAMGSIDVRVNNKILDMYSKCGSMADAYQLFEKMPHRNLTSWDTMIMGLASNSHGEEAIDLFTEFKQKGLTPDGGLFIGVFSACGVLGAVDEGMLHFQSMKSDFGISPNMEHYVSIVDMLGKSGYVDEALEFIEKMPIEPSIDVWETLMNLCRLNGSVELGDRCAEIVEHLDPSRLTEQARNGLIPLKASDLEREKQRKKNSNLLEVRSRVHEYRAGDRSHPENDKIYEQIRGLAPQMKEAGYIPETRFVLHDIDQESKEEALLYHSERLAVAYGLMTSAARSPIRIIKNLRVCGDCHNAMKIISKLVGRQLIARDAKRFHHFEHGVCSCKDYW